MEDHAQLKFARDRLAFAGLLPIAVLAIGGASDFFEFAFSASFVALFSLGPLMLLSPVAILLAGGAVLVLVRACWALARPRNRMNLATVLGLALAVAMGLVTALIDVKVHAGKANPEWMADQLWKLEGAYCLAALAALLLLREVLARLEWDRRLVFKVGEAILIALAWGLAAFTVPNLVSAANAASTLRAAQVAAALRIEPTSTDPYVIALCHGDDAAVLRLKREGRITDASARDAWQCVPANGALFPSERRDRFSVARARVADIVETLYDRDPLVTRGSRDPGPCTVGEANLVRRLADVAPQDLSLLNGLRNLPTDCVEDDPARTPIWWRTAHRWEHGDRPTAVQLDELKEAWIKLDQPDAHGRALAIVLPGDKAASTP